MSKVFAKFWSKNEKEGNKDQKDVDTVSFVSGQYGATRALNDAAATDAMVDGMNKFMDMSSRVEDKLPHFRMGHLFEAIVAAKENAAAAKAGSSAKMFVTHLEGNHTSSADLQVRIGDRVISQGQAKFSVLSAGDIVTRIADEKYYGMDRYIPSNKIEGVKMELLEQIRNTDDPVKLANLHDTLRHLKETHTTTLEVKGAEQNSSYYAQTSELKFLAKEASVAAGQAAAAGFIVGGAISTINNIIAVQRGMMSKDEAINKTLGSAFKSSARGGITGISGSLIRYGATKTNVQPLTQSNVATAMAACLIDIGVTVYDYSKGEISAEVVIERVGQSGFSTISSIYSGMVACLVLGPGAFVVGSMVGYLVASQVYQTCVAVVKNANLAEEEAVRVIALCEEATREMQRNREQFEALVNERIEYRDQTFRNCFLNIDRALEVKDHDIVTNNLAMIAEIFGKKLSLVKFDEFDKTMLAERPLIL